MELTNTDKEYLLKIARDAITTITLKNERITPPQNCPEYLKEKLGVFCTINKNNNLRGCIGYPEPIKPLIEAIIDVSISATINDPRFPSLTEDEIEKIKIEITILTKPTLIKVDKPEEYPNKINIGQDGLIVRSLFTSGLLLPQVAIEYNMNETEFLENTCLKAGLNPDSWLNNKNINIYKVQGQKFEEWEKIK